MDTIDYFRNSVMIRRPYLKEAWLQQPLTDPIQSEIQPNGRIRYWTFIEELGKYLRVVTEADGQTIHNAFPDRRFKPEGE